MYRKLIFLISLVLVLGLGSNASANDWTDEGTDHLWNNGDNWSGGVPGAGVGVNFALDEGEEGPTLEGTGTCGATLFTGSVDGTFTVTEGATLTITSGETNIAKEGPAFWTWDIRGTVDASTGCEQIHVGAYFPGKLIMTGIASITLGGKFKVGQNAGDSSFPHH